MSCVGYKQAAVRTGYEQVIPHRTSDLFAHTARKPGKVITASPTGITVEYNDGTKEGFEVGRRFGAAAGLVIPHEVVTTLKPGDTFEEGTPIVFNDGFFEPDVLNPKNVIWKAGVTVKTVLYESSQTIEDASSISRRLAQQLTTKTTKIKTVIVNFDQVIKTLVKNGSLVEHESILCIIEDAVTSSSNLFDEDSLNTLRVLSSQTPTAKVKGVVERIEVFYHGEKEEMSESLRALANLSDKEVAMRNRSQGKPIYSGSVNEALRIDNEPLSLDTAAIRFYITSDVSAGVGD